MNDFIRSGATRERRAALAQAPMSCGMSLVSRAFCAVRSLATRLQSRSSSVFTAAVHCSLVLAVLAPLRDTR